MDSVAGTTLKNLTNWCRTSSHVLLGALVFLVVLVGGTFFQPTAVEAVNLGTWATSTAVGNNDNWRAVTYGNGRFVAVASSTASAGSDTIMTSTDGITWTAVATSSAANNDDSWLDVEYANGIFVAVGSSSNPSRDVVMTSTTGLIWATSTAAGDNDRWESVTYGNGRFVAVGSGPGTNRVMTSTDGVTWASSTVAGNNDDWQSVTYGNGRFVAVGSGGDRVMTSTDGLTWGVVNAAGNDDQWSGVTFGNNRFVAVASSTSASADRVMWSDDGQVWTPVASTTAAVNNDNWFDVIYGNGIFMAIGSSTNPSRDVIIYSLDGITWSTSTAAGDNDQWRAIAYGNGRFVGVGTAVGDRVMYALSTSWSLTQSGFQFRNDNGSEVAATSVGGQNSNVTWGLNTPVRLRTQIESVLATTTSSYYLQYKKTSDPAWSTVGVDSAFPTITATSSGRTTGNATSHPITLPGRVEVGDLLLVIFSHDGASTSLSTSTGWVKLGEGSNILTITETVTGAVYWKRATDSNALTITTVGSEESSHVVYAIRNAGTPSGQLANGNSTNSNPPAHGVFAVRPHLVIATRSGDNVTVATVAPTGYSGFISQAANTAAGASTNAAESYITASTTDPGTFTSATEQWVSWTIMVPPADTPTTRNILMAEGKAPATSTNDAAIGTIAWTAPGNATTSNESWATLTTAGVAVSNYLEVTQFGFNIPAQATILGVEAFIEKFATGGATGTVRDSNIRLVKAGAATGNNYALTALAWSSTTEEVTKYGSTTDRWGATWLPSEINATDFGIDIAVTGNLAGADRVARIDHVTLNVYYTMGSNIILTASANIAANGASTTARLVSPGTFSTSSFKGGHITEDQAPTPVVQASSSSYTELEWSVMATGTATSSDVYQFRTSIGLDGKLSEYTGAPLLTIGTTPTLSTVTLTGTAYRNSAATTTLGIGAEVVAAVNLGGNPVLFSTSTRAGGVFTLPLSVGTSSAPSGWNVVAAAGNNDTWQSVTYGNGRFVAVGTGSDRIMYSDDGLNWATSSGGGNNDQWQSVTYGAGRFVAVGDGPSTDRVMYSDDGITWATTSAAGNDDNWNGVTYGNGLFVAISVTGAMVSANGVSWTEYVIAGGYNFSSVTYGNGLFVAASLDGADQIHTSSNGQSWTIRTTPGTGGYADVTYGNGRFVAVGGSGDVVIYSNDGLTWATTTAAGNDDSWNGVTYGNGRFVAVGGSGDRIMYSDNGLSWVVVATTSAVGNDDTWRSLVYGNGRFVAVGDVGDRVMVSLEEQLGLLTPVTLFTNSTTSATTFVGGLATTSSTLTNVPLYGTTMLVYNATTTSSSSVTNLSTLSFFDSIDDSNVLYTASTTGTTTILADVITATGTTRMPDRVIFNGDFIQNGTIDTNGGLIEFTGTDAIVSGTLTGTSSLNNVSIGYAPGGQNWVSQADPGGDNDWYSVTYGNGRFVAVGAYQGNDRIMYSNDGITWATTTAVGLRWLDVTYGNDRFVAVGTLGNRTMMSLDGITWTEYAAADNDDSWISVTYGNGRFVAVGDGDSDEVMYSSDGMTWATTTAAGDNDNWQSVTYGNGLFVAVSAYSDTPVITSPDGITWTAQSAAGNDDNWSEVTYGNGLFVAVSGESTDKLMTSPNGVTWTVQTASIGNGGMSGLTFGNGQFVSVGGDPIVMTSPDGITWTAVNASDNNESWVDVTYGNGLFVAVGQSAKGNQVMTVNNKITFNSPVLMQNVSVDKNTIFGIASSTTIAGNLTNSGRIENTATVTFSGVSKLLTAQATATAFVHFGNVVFTASTTIVGNSTTSDLTINSGATVVASSTYMALTGDLNQNGSLRTASSTAFAGKAPIATGNLTAANAFGSLIITEPIDPWVGRAVPSGANNDEWGGIAYGNGLFVAVSAYSDDKVMTSPDGISWTLRSAPGTVWTDVVFGNGQFVAVGDNGTRVMTSPDGIAWTAQSAAGNDDNWLSVTYGEGLYVAVGSGGDYVMTSPDGVNWTARTAAGGANNWSAVAYGNGRFVAGAGYDGVNRVMYSEDGFTWATTTAAGDNDWWTGLEYGNGLFVAVAGYNEGSEIITSPDGVTWTERTPLGNIGDLTDITFGNRQFVAVSNGFDRVMTSFDGVTWSTVTAAGNNEGWAAVTYGNSRFVAVGGFFSGEDRVMTYIESDFVTTLATSTSVTSNLSIATTSILVAPTSTLSIAGNFKNLGTFAPRAGTTTLSGTAKTITGNLTSWDATTQSPDYGLTNVTGTYTYVGSGSTSALTINSGASLTASSSGLLTVAHNFTNNGTYTNNGATTTFGGNLTGRATGTNALGNTVINARSQGFEWQAIATSSAAGNDDGWKAITYGNGRFVAVSNAGTDIMFSDDGLTWTGTSSPSSPNDWVGITYGNGRFVAVGYSGDRVMYSSDGITWTKTAAAGNDDGWSGVTYGNGLFVAVADNGTDRVMYSSDGITWATTSAAGNDDAWSAITYGNGRFVAVESSFSGPDKVIYSDDGIAWTVAPVPNAPQFYSVTYGNGRFVAVGAYTGDKFAVSFDGIVWSSVNALGNDDEYTSVTYGNGRFVAVSNTVEGFAYSRDGISWATTTVVGDNDDFRAVTFGVNRFVAVGENGDRIAVSVPQSTFVNNASTSNLTINASSTLNASGTTVTVAGNYTNSGALTASSSTFIFNGTGMQVATGTMSATSSFRNLTLSNTSGNGTTSRSIIFGAPLTVTGTSTITASTSVEFVAGATTSIATALWQGSAGSPVYLRSSATGTQSFLTITGNKTLDYVNVRDSNASSTAGGITPVNSTDAGNNANWNFTTPTPVWNATDWTLFDTITIQEENIDTDLTDFPVYVNLDDLSSTFWSTTPAGASLVGTDIRVTTAANDEVPRELVFASSTLGTGELHFKAPSLSSTTDTTFKIWYNGTTTGDYANTATYGADNVWTNDFVAVYHLQEDPSGGVGAVRDSTRFNHDGTGSSTMTSADLVATKLGRGFDFDGATTDQVTFATSSAFANLNTVSVCTWYQFDSYANAYGQLIDKSSNAFDSWNFSVINDGDFGMQSRAGGYRSASNTPTVGSWRYLCSTNDGNGGAAGIALYKNGVNAGGFGSGFSAGSDDTNTPLSIGSGKLDYQIDGRMDEVRVASTTRTAAWIKAEYYNQSTSTDFYSVVGASSAWNATDWTLFDTITIQEENIDTDLTDFPVYVNLDDLSSTFWSTTPAGASLVGTDIRVTTAANVEVPRELVFASSTLGTGELHFKAPSISSTTNTTFKIWYNGTTTGDYANTATYGAQNVWTNDFIAVYHLNEDPGVAGTSGILDSTVSALHGTDAGTMTSADKVAGRTGYAIDFDGTDDLINMTIENKFYIGEGTVGVWYRPDNMNTNDKTPWSYSDSAITNGNVYMQVRNQGDVTNGRKPSVFSYDTATRLYATSFVATSTWNYSAVTFNNSNLQQIYHNGLFENSRVSNDGMTNTAASFGIGALGVNNAPQSYFQGPIDEVRVSTTTRTASWIKAEYTNQSTTTLFYGVNLTGAVGSSTIANHTSGQVNNTFTAGPKTNESLFAFLLTPNSGVATVTDAVISLSGVQGFNPVTGLTNLRLFRDLDNDALYDVTDTQVGGAGAIVGANQNGTLTFTTDFLSTTSQNYLVVGDWSAPADGSFITFNLFPSGLSIIDATSSQSVFGSVSSAQHFRNNRGAGGRNANIGGDAPAGNGTTTGGGTPGGQLIGDDPDFFWPNANSGSWNSGANAYDRIDGTYATTSAAVTHTYTNPGFAIPTNNTIGGIEVKLELGASTGAGTVNVELSWNGGTNWTTAKTTPTLTTADTVRIVGAPSDLWGRSWTASEFSNANFAVRLTGAPSANTIRVDALQIKVYHQSSGGSQGGGGGGI